MVGKGRLESAAEKDSALRQIAEKQRGIQPPFSADAMLDKGEPDGAAGQAALGAGVAS